jgi:mono/diheme cytochrome c family protein
LATNCYTCHNAKLASGGLDLTLYRDARSFDAARDVWEKILGKLNAGTMPPKGAPRPSREQVRSVTVWLEAELARRTPPDAESVIARRLNRFEYNATIRDLLGVDFNPADDFPADEFSYGFDNIGDALSISPALMEKYLAAAKEIARRAIEPPRVPKNPVVEHHANVTEVRPFVWNRNFPWEADYDIRLAVPYDEGNGRHDPGTLFISIDGAPPRSFALAMDYGNEGRLQDLRVHLTSGLHQIKTWVRRDAAAAVERDWKYVRDAHQRNTAMLANALLQFALSAPSFSSAVIGATAVPYARDWLRTARVTKDGIAQATRAAPQPFVEWIEIRGPYQARPAPVPAAYKRIFVCDHPPGRHTEACTRANLADLARRAWRRPVTDAEVSKLTSFVSMARVRGDTTDKAMRVGVMAVLVAPQFLFRIENAPASRYSSQLIRIGEFELATRLSYFLWSSMPDEELYRLARESKLSDPAIRERQVRRMLNDPKAQALVDNFGGQWLHIRNLDHIRPDPDIFPQYTEALRQFIKQETRLFFYNIIREDRSVLDFLTAKYTFLNEPLARFYGIPGVSGDEFRKVDLTGTPRIGIITQASVLTASSYPTRTSPVIRGKWILENILNTPPPAPPANVPALAASGTAATGSVRQRLERHRADPMCAGCHAAIDPLGFGLENFDGIGRWRTMDGRYSVNAKGILPSGKSFSTPEELVRAIAADKQAFTRCLAEKLMIFALGRGLKPADQTAVDLIVRRVAERGYRFSSLILEIVESVPFQTRFGPARLQRHSRPAAIS